MFRTKSVIPERKKFPRTSKCITHFINLNIFLNSASHMHKDARYACSECRAYIKLTCACIKVNLWNNFVWILKVNVALKKASFHIEGFFIYCFVSSSILPQSSFVLLKLCKPDLLCSQPIDIYMSSFSIPIGQSPIKINLTLWGAACCQMGSSTIKII